MDANPISKRGRGSEEEHFRKLERERLAARERVQGRADELGQLAETLGLPDPARCESLLALGITAETAPAFEALPLVEVACADGRVDKEERWRVLEAATRLGVELGRPAHALLECWLAQRPRADLFAAWHDLAPRAPAGGRLLDAAERVAQSAGGVLGFGVVSRAERRALDGIRNSLADAAERTP